MNQYHSEERSIADPAPCMQAPGTDEVRRARQPNMGEPRGATHALERGTSDIATPDDTSRIRRVGIMGANATGIVIAASLLAADIPVTLFELARKTLDRATAEMRANYRQAVADGELAASQADRRVALLAGTVNLHHLKDCDVIIDALDAGPDAGDGLIRRLNEIARPGAVLVACTPGADIDRIAALARFPANVLAMRPSVTGTSGQWELVAGRATSTGALAIASGLVRNAGKPDVVAAPAALS